MFVNLKNGLLQLLVKKPKFMAGWSCFVTSRAETVASRNCYSQKSKLAISLGPLKYFLRFIFSESVAQKCPVEKCYWTFYGIPYQTTLTNLFFNGFFLALSEIFFLRISNQEMFCWKNALEHFMEFPSRQPW